jgi:hypothetical protein
MSSKALRAEALPEPERPVRITRSLDFWTGDFCAGVFWIVDF